MEEGDEGLEEALGLKTPQENSRIITGTHMDSQRACLHGTDLASLHICMYVTVVYRASGTPNSRNGGYL